MANFKKGIALALVATTAFTFAPVANLGTPVVAEAAVAITVPVKDAAANGVDLTLVESDDPIVSSAISLDDVKFVGAKEIKIKSSNPAVAVATGAVGDTLTADANTFTITANDNGSATISVMADTTVVYDIHVTVRTASRAAELSLGDSVRATKEATAVTVHSAYDSKPTPAVPAKAIASSDKSIASFDEETGKVTFLKAGAVTLTFSYQATPTVGTKNGETEKVTKTVNVLPATATLTVEGKNAAENAGQTVKVVELTKENPSYQINAALTNATEGKKIVYSAGPKDGFTLDEKTGLVTANATAFAASKPNNELEVTVKTDAAAGDDANLNGVTAKVKFVAVSETKKLTSLKVTADGQEKETKATLNKDYGVENAPTVSFDKVVLSTDDKQTLDLAVVATPDKAVITSDDKAVVEVNGTTLTAKKAGKANVTVKVASDANYFGDAIITIPVEVISGKANNTIVTNSVTLSKTVKTAKDYATATVDKTVLSYRFVKYDAATKTYVADNPTDVTLDAKTGELKYITENAGSVIVEVTGKAPAGAADPKPAYVTVSYSNKKEASKLAVATKSVNVEAGKTAAIVATGTALTFASSDETIATVAADGTVTGVKSGVAIITVTDAGDENTEGGSVDVPVYVKAKAAVVVAKPAKVTGLKVANVKGAKIKVSFKKSAKATGYLVSYKVGKKTVKKNTTKTALNLSVKKGATVKVTVKAFNKNAAGAKQYSAAVSKTFKTDKK